MLGRILAIALNTYREAVRARVLHGLLALAFATVAYSLVVATLSLHQEARVVADLGAASISLYAVLVAVVLGATSLHRELELKTVYPILTRRLRRHEYIVGKYVGMLLTLAVFVALDAGVVLGVLALESGQSRPLVSGVSLGAVAVLGALLLRARHTRVFVLLPWALAFFLVAYLLAEPAAGERQLVVASAALTLCEVAIVAGVATLFASFSSPFLTAIFTIGVFLVGRSADTLANLPSRLFGEGMRTAGQVLARIFPNLHVYVPPRPLLLGQVPDVAVWGFVGNAAAHALFYATVLVTVGALVFQRRDFA
jgi:ABC-type transport system involved in multi-copper enzyme maturation permease subunit